MIGRRARRHRGVSLIEADVTGMDGPRPAFPADTDLVVSLNLVSQLGVAPGIDAETRMELRRRHLAETLSLNCTICIIGDVERRETDRRTGKSETTPIDWAMPAELPGPAETGEWPWPVAPHGEAAAGREISTTVRVAIWSPHLRRNDTV